MYEKYGKIKKGNKKKMKKNSENNNVFSDLLLELYKNNKIKIIWSRKGCSIKFDDDVEFEQVDRKDFINYSFNMIYIIRALLLNKPINNIDENDLLIAKEMVKSQEKYRDDIILKSSSLLDTYSKSDIEVISHLNVENDKTIKSAIIKIYYENDDDEKNINIEMTKNDLIELSLQINELLSKLE